MYVLATAGHVDHGKSTLIERLTGIDPDRLAEEKARGLTIDLGFAWLTLPSGREAGIVDVPGHERFVHNMLAGVGSVDSVLFVVATNEGWMPQSEEHLQILDLVGARRAVVALTKRDLVGEEEIEIARSMVRDRLAGSALHDAEIVAVSARSGEGCDELLHAIDRMLDDIPLDDARPRVWVDRSFSIKGAGTVVTGTLTGGTLRIDDEVVVMPHGSRARIRGIQSHRSQRPFAEPVARVALNLAGVDRARIRRGDAIVLPEQWRPSAALDVSIRTVRTLDHELSGRGAFKAYIGSAEVDARISLYSTRALGRAERGFARVTLADPVVAAPGDRFVLRDAGRATTVAGGEILDAHAPAVRGSARPARVEALRARAAAERSELPDVVVAERGIVARADLPWLTGTNDEPKDAVLLPTYAVSRARYEALGATIERVLGDFHAREPFAAGMPREDARAALGIDDARLFAELLDSLTDRIAVDGATIRLASHAPERDTPERAAVLDEVRTSQPPALKDLSARHGEKLVRAMLQDGTLVRLEGEIVFSAEQIEASKRTIRDAVTAEGPLTAARIKEVLGTSRKYAIPLLEHLDRTGFTRRNGDARDVR